MRLTRVDLPEPVGPTMARLAACGDAEVDVVEGCGSVGVGEGQVAELYAAGNGRYKCRSFDCALRASLRMTLFTCPNLCVIIFRPKQSVIIFRPKQSLIIFRPKQSLIIFRSNQSAVIFQSDQCGVVGDVGLLLEEFVDADYGGGAALEEVDYPAYGDDGPDELDHVDVEAGELSDADLMLDYFVSSDEEGDHQREAEDELQRGPEHGHESDEVEAAADVLLVGELEGGDLGFFLGEGSDEAGAGEVLLGFGGDVGEHGLNALKALVDAGSEVLDEDGGHGQRDEGEEGEARADAIHER